VGKTPFAKTLATSGLATRQYRTSSELDFFRGEQGDVLRPDIFDDGDSSAQNTKSMKAFSDVSLQEAAVWARWGGCRWPKGCFRQALDNKVDLTKEIDDHSLSITHENFMELVSPAFHKDANQSDREAILKRRMCKVGRRGHSDLKGAEVFSAGYRLAHPGFHGVARALRAYQNWVMDTTAPGDAFSLGWWKVD
jgi:hypothetical protein